MRAIDPAGLPPCSSGFAPGPAPMLQWVKVADLVVDETYQRPIRGAGRKNVAAIAEAFSWSKFAPLIVSPVAGGRYAVIDGQHRATAAALRGVDQLPAQVIIADVADQAAAFKAVNGQTTRMHALEIHRAAVTAGDDEALRLEAVCARANAAISKHPRVQSRMKPGETNAIGAIRAQLRTAGEDVLVLALRCITENASNNKPGGLPAIAIEALCGMLMAHPEWVDRPDEVVAAFGGIVVLREADKARFEPREKGVGAWETLRDRLSRAVTARLAPAISRAA